MTLPAPNPGPEKSGFDFFGYLSFLVYNEIWAALGYGEKAVLIPLMKRADNRAGQAFPTLALLCREAGVYRETAQRAIKNLVRASLLKKRRTPVRAGKRRVVYTLVWPLENPETIKRLYTALLSAQTIKRSPAALLRDLKGRFSPKTGAPAPNNKAAFTDKTIKRLGTALKDLRIEEKKEEEGDTSAKTDINVKEVRKPDTAQPRPFSKGLFRKLVEAGGPGKIQAEEALAAGRIILTDESQKEDC